MADTKTPQERSLNMAKIRSKDTKPEEYIRKKLFAMGYRYRKNSSSISGHPDIWMPKYNVAIFVNGCYWHRHKGCKYAYTPKSNVEFWLEKFRKNVQRDQKVIDTLERKGIKVLVVWECTTKDMRKSDEVEKYVLQRIKDFVTDRDGYYLEV